MITIAIKRQTHLEFIYRGSLRKDRRTKRLVQRLRSGDIALLDHPDLDRVAAESLLHCGVKVVLNSSPFCSGLFPPEALPMLFSGGVHLIELSGCNPFDRIEEGDTVTVRGGNVLLGNAEIIPGRVVTRAICENYFHRAAFRRTRVLDRFILNTLTHAFRERRLITARTDPPPLQTRIRGRHVVVAVRGKDFRQDLKAIRVYLREKKPVLIGVDGGADALLECGLVPDVIIGDMDSVSDPALRLARERVVHAYMDGRGVPGGSRLERLDLSYQVYRAPGTSEDIALLISFELGAELIVAVGTHISVTDFLEKGRRGMASTFLVRLKVGDRLVDARGVSRLYGGYSIRGLLPVLFLAGVLPAAILFIFSPPVQHLLRLLWLRLRLVLS